jgi:hypothetical protein
MADGRWVAREGGRGMSRGRGQALETNKGSRLCAEKFYPCPSGRFGSCGRIVFVLIIRR